uniref:Innexin n=1 Tax=Timema genevievae TaxID=629358 RepID=A0A7R9K918_TIMGE|nr:unnamed protein product [Timema genevievae]
MCSLELNSRQFSLSRMCSLELNSQQLSLSRMFRKMSVFGLVSAIAGFVKVRFLVDKEVTDNTVFRFHYRLTSAMFFMSCILVTANSLIGEPISCLVTDDKLSKPINTYCWIMSTFTLPHQLHKKEGSEVLHPGVGDYVEEVHEKRYHAYYQWVPLMLFFQGVLFYVPHWIWKNCEQGKIKMISDGIRGSASWNESDRCVRKHKLVQYLVDSLHMHNVYAAIYFFCEALNFANAVGNIYLIDKFLGGAFLTYGTDVVKFNGMDQMNRTDPMIIVFPRMTKCNFYMSGPSGRARGVHSVSLGLEACTLYL